jgi:signal transduction histidine kinase
MLSDLAEDAKADTDELSMLHLRIRAMTRRSSTAVRHFAGLLNANGLYTDLASDIRRASERIMDKFEQDVTVVGGEHLHKLDASTGFDLFLFYKECLVNIIRHSGATRFSTRLAAAPRWMSAWQSSSSIRYGRTCPKPWRSQCCQSGNWRL